MANLYTHKDSNIRKTWLLMSGFLILVIGLGYVFSYVYQSPEILYVAVGFSLVMNIVAYFKSDAIAIAMSGARPVTREQNIRFYRIMENLSITAGLPLPRLYVIGSDQINAFATGRNPQHAAVAVTEGALRKLDDNELQGVLAHELSHIGNRDILVATVAVVLAGFISMLADFFMRITFWGGDNRNRRGNNLAMLVGLVAAVLAPIAATLIQLAISRKREFLADASGALLTRYPDGLASALLKIREDSTPMRAAKTATAHLFIANPFKGKEGASWFVKLFMTHPPIEDRVAALRGMQQ